REPGRDVASCWLFGVESERCVERKFHSFRRGNRHPTWPREQERLRARTREFFRRSDRGTAWRRHRARFIHARTRDLIERFIFKRRAARDSELRRNTDGDGPCDSCYRG